MSNLQGNPNARPLGFAYGAVLLAISIAPASSEAESPLDTLHSQLQALAETHGFLVKGLERVNDEMAEDARGDLHKILSTLLAGYGYVVTHDNKGAIEKLIILGPRGAEVARAPVDVSPPDVSDVAASEHRIATQRLGSLHSVKAFVAGPKRRGRWVWLVVDGDVSTLILPASMMRQLGFNAEDLSEEWTETAEGGVTGKRATVNVAVSDVVRRDIEVTFVEDGTLGTDKVLGMSFLDEFRFNIDEVDDQLILVRE